MFLQNMFRIEDNALNWFRTDLIVRTHSIVVSDREPYKHCRYCRYTLPLAIIIRIFWKLFYMYGDAKQLYKSIDPINFENQKQNAEQLHLSTSEISKWMPNNKAKTQAQ